MASPLDLRGRVVITDAGATATLNRIKGSLAGVGAMSGKTTATMFAGNAVQSMALATDRLQRSLVGLRTTIMGAGFAFGTLVASTRDFNESKFGYGFARITDHIKDGKLQLDDWKASMNAAAKEARQKATDLGISPDVTMRATEETEKLGFEGRTSLSVRDAALGLHMSEPDKLDAGASAKYLGAVFRAYEKQMEAQAEKEGINRNDSEAWAKFTDKVLKGYAAKTAIAGAKSALGPADIVEGMRQFAPQWAAMNIPFEAALAMLANASNVGFTAPEIGTSLKSMTNKAQKPTAAGLRILNNLGIDRSQFFTTGQADPMKAAQRLNSLLDGQLFSGKDGTGRRNEWLRNMRAAHERGELNSPEFQELMTQRALKALGRGWEGRADAVRTAVSNATTSPTGGFDLLGYIRTVREKGATTADLLEIFEGRHIARNSPHFEKFESLMGLLDSIQSVDGTVIDAILQGRKESEAGKTDAMLGAIKDLMVALQETAPVQGFKNAIIELTNALKGAPASALSATTAAIIGLGAAAGGIAVLGTAARIIGSILKPVAWLGALIAGTAGGAALKGVGLGAGVIGAPILTAGGKTAARMGLRFIPGLGLVLIAGGAVIGGLTAMSNGASASEVARETALGAMGLDGIMPTGSAGPNQTPIPDSMFGMTDPADAAPGGGISAASAAAEIEQVRAEAARGAAMMQESMGALASAIQTSVATVAAAAQSAAAQMRASAASASAVQLNTGPSMRGAN